MFQFLFLALGIGQAIQNKKYADREYALGVKAQNVQKAQGQIQNKLNRRTAVREAMIKRSRLMANAYNSGVGKSSGEIGSAFALSGELSKNIAIQTEQTRFTNTLSKYNFDIAKVQSDRNLSNDLFSIANAGLKTVDAFSPDQ